MADVQHQADECGVALMIVDATARDILIRHIVGTLPERATTDIDVVVAPACADGPLLTLRHPNASRLFPTTYVVVSRLCWSGSIRQREG